MQWTRSKGVSSSWFSAEPGTHKAVVMPSGAVPYLYHKRHFYGQMVLQDQ